MRDQPPQNLKFAARNLLGGSQILLVFVSLAALSVTFGLANSDFDFERKAVIFSATVVVYLAFCALIYFRQVKPSIKNIADDAAAEISGREITNRLFALEEANRFFGASLKPRDTFRLAASRVRELVPFAVCLLYLIDETGTAFNLAFAENERAEPFEHGKNNQKINLDAKTFDRQKVESGGVSALELSFLPEDVRVNLRSSAAVPLAHKGEVFAVLKLFSGRKNDFDDRIELLEAVGERLAPLFANSMRFEQNLSNALTDALTNLPNERAFFLVLENQIAETMRFPNERPLSIIAADIKNFAEINRQYGHATGDRILSFAGEIIKRELRRMDFPARSAADEFLAVLPTASEKTTAEIIVRVERAFAADLFEVTGGEKIDLKLNFGTATFGSDGDSAQRLLATALLKKQQNKNPAPPKVLWFPKEYVN